MDTGISAEEACRVHALSDEDFARMCNADGTLKNQPATTTFTFMNDPSKSIKVDNSALYLSAALVVLVVIFVVVLLIKRKKT